MKRIFISLYFCSLSLVFSQTVFEPVNNSIYSYLQDMAIKGIVNLNEFNKPYSRMEIAKILVEISNNNNRLSKIENDELKFYSKDYISEFVRLNSFPKDVKIETKIDSSAYFIKDLNNRFRLFSYDNKFIAFYVDPIFGYTIGNNDNSNFIHRWNGVKTYGYISENIGFSLNFRDNLESGKLTDRKRDFSLKDGINLTVDGKKDFEYDIVNASLSYNWYWGDITFAKDHEVWGSGKHGQLILSTKSPSFVFVKLRIKPVKWIDFIYLHGWLESDLIDSSTIRFGYANRTNYVDREKYIALHAISFYPYSNLRFTLGESIVYSDKLEPIYFIPVMFFRVADHYLSKKNSNTGSNAQIFADVSYTNNYLKTKFYTTLFIDELSVSSIVDGSEGPAAVAYTFGLQTYNPFLENNTITLEYSRLNPFIYMNSNPAQQYSNHSYQLGHWIGSNADMIYFSINQRLIRGLNVCVWAEYIRKGQKETYEQQYKLPYPSFLFGDKSYYTNLGIDLKYEFIHDLNIVSGFQYNKIDKRYLSGLDIYKNQFYLTVNYGI